VQAPAAQVLIPGHSSAVDAILQAGVLVSAAQVDLCLLSTQNAPSVVQVLSQLQAAEGMVPLQLLFVAQATLPETNKHSCASRAQVFTSPPEQNVPAAVQPAGAVTQAQLPALQV
jgi:hypothetical protein